ncbi:universal stress protein [Kitasatospora sp. RB6PN24]|uniref:universal stress protein n=1 Tax=Kitasatospora humi TaxID=2893891 RepID=UPI001E4A14A3|nr:universal stress protein [Kitasatospora humi]MCC9309551.1 universal stress protein [Kitasatospora humi]
MDNEAEPAGRIVVGVDGSAPSTAALRWAARQAALTGGVVEAVTVWQYPPAYGAGLAAGGFDFEANAAQVLTQAIDEALGTERSAEIRPLVAYGHPADVLLKAARGAELLVVGNRGRGGLTGTLLGSVSQHLVQHAPCPVVVIRDPAGATSG